MTCSFLGIKTIIKFSTKKAEWITVSLLIFEFLQYHHQRQRGGGGGGGRGQSFTSNYRPYENRNLNRSAPKAMPDCSLSTEYVNQQDFAFSSATFDFPPEPPVFVSESSEGPTLAKRSKKALSGAKAVDFFNIYDGDLSLSDNSDG